MVTEGGGVISRVALPPVFDAEVGTPALVDQVELVVPHIREIMEELRGGLPVMPHCGVGSLGEGAFFRLPNHYRSVCQILRSRGGRQDLGVVVLKGTEPLIPDFASYLDWMVKAPFRSAMLPMGLHFPLEMRLPPGAMWIEECMVEQRVASELHQRYLDRHESIARIPLPLFVFALTPDQNASYRDAVRARVSDDAYSKIKNKISDGFGVEVYYYPELPVRVADLYVGNVRGTFKAFLEAENVERTVEKWVGLFAEILCLDAMPYVPWHVGMGACVDSGNACIDGGFSDLLTLVSFDAIPTESLFQESIHISIKSLSETIIALVAASNGVSSVVDRSVTRFVMQYVKARLRETVLGLARDGYVIDERLKRYFFPPGPADVVAAVRGSHQRKAWPGQYLGAASE